MALINGKLFGTDKDIDILLQRLADETRSRDAEFITVFYGEDVSEEEAERTEALFAGVCPDAELSLLSGGQPVYYYIISIE